MKIKNDLQSFPLACIFTFGILSVFVTFVALLMNDYPMHDFSFVNFFDCIVYIKQKNFEAFGMVVITYVAFIGSILGYGNERKKFNSELNLKSVEFLPDRVSFKFNKSQCDLICGYENIDKMMLELKTSIVRDKYYGKHKVLSQIFLNFELISHKNFSLTFMPINNYMKKIYGILDAGRRVQDFSYKFTGVGAVEDVEEKIKDYLATGCKQILASRKEDLFKFLSILLFVTGLFFLYRFNDCFSNMSILFLIFMPGPMFLVVSFGFDIVLLVDKWNESKYKRF